jgi:hypothetical protein
VIDLTNFALQDPLRDALARALRRDPQRVPGSLHFASVLAYGDFILADGKTIRCEAIPGISGVHTSHQLEERNGRSHAPLKRILTHFHFAQPSVMIEQHPAKASTGTLQGTGKGADGLLPGKASFSQYLILTLEGRPLANREALVMTAERVEEWPPIGSTFVSEGPIKFYDLEQVNNPKAELVATLDACKAVNVTQLFVPDR